MTFKSGKNITLTCNGYEISFGVILNNLKQILCMHKLQLTWDARRRNDRSFGYTEPVWVGILQVGCLNMTHTSAPTRKLNEIDDLLVVYKFFSFPSIR